MEIIKQLRKEKKITQGQLAEAMNVSRSTIAMWETSGSCPKQESLKKLADYFLVSTDYLLGRITNENQQKNFLSADEQQVSQERSSVSSVTYSNQKREISNCFPTQKIPILGKVAAGLPLYADQNIEGYTYTERRGKNQYFALRIRGDSMTAARIFDGDIIIVRKQDIVEDGEIAVVLVDNEATVKRFYQDHNKVILMPQSENKIHKPQIYDITQHDVRILGKVVEIKVAIE